MTEKPSNRPATGSEALDDDTLYADLVGQTARVEWTELERFFAKGQLLRISASLDLVEVAMAMVRDHSAAVADWQAAHQLAPLDTETARRWAHGESALWAVVTPPWILVQETDRTSTHH